MAKVAENFLSSKPPNLREQLEAILQQQDESHEVLSEEIGVTPKTLARFRRSEGRGPAQKTLKKIENYIETKTSASGFGSKITYLAIAKGMGAELNDKKFIEYLKGEYYVIRAHVPSRRPLVSTLVISSNDGIMIKYTHRHVTQDVPAFFANSNDGKKEYGYEGFVFVCDMRLFFISTAYDTGSMKMMIFRLSGRRRTVDAEGKGLQFLRGILLTVSHDDREPFAARIYLHRPQQADGSDPRWEPGLHTWNEFSDLEKGLGETGILTHRLGDAG